MKKILVLIAILLFVPRGTFAQEMGTFVISDFSKGLNTHSNDFLTEPNQGKDIQNIRFNKKFGSLYKRQPMLLYGTPGAYAVTSLHRFYESDGSKTLISTGSTVAQSGNDSTGVFTNLQTGLTDGKRWQWITYKDLAIGSNGSDQPIKWDGDTITTANTDGARTANDLTAQLGACFAELNTGTSLDASKWYVYKVVYYDGTTYYYSDAKSNPVLLGADVHNVQLTGIPIGPSGITHRYIYRTSGHTSRANAMASTTYYMCYEIANNTATTQADSIDDTTLEGDRAPTWTTASGGTDITPPTGKYLALQKNRLFIGGNTTYLSDIYFSEEFLPDYFNPAHYTPIRPDDGDKITGFGTLFGNLFILKQNSIQQFYTEDSTVTNWFESDPISFVGCHAPYSIASTPKGLVYLNKKGLYNFDGRSSSLMSDITTGTINDISQEEIEEASGVYLNNEYHLAYTSESSGEDNNNRVLVYNFIRDSYSIDIKEINSFCAFNAGTDEGILYSGSSDTDGKIYGNEEAFPDLTIRYKSELDLGTYDDTRTIGDEKSPAIELAWDCTIDGWLTELQTKDASITDIDSIETYITTATIDRPDTDGTWTSDVYQINANSLNELSWNERLKGSGDITMQIRLGASAAACASASWETAVSDPNGSDVSSITANDYIQLRANLSTTNIAVSPELYYDDGYTVKLTYYTTGDTLEDSFLSQWSSGWTDFGVPSLEKKIERIKVFYKGTDGTLSFNFKNLKSLKNSVSTDTTFDIDLSVDPEDGADDQYTGLEQNKVYNYFPPRSTMGQYWKFTISETGQTEWQVDKVEIIYSTEELRVI